MKHAVLLALLGLAMFIAGCVLVAGLGVTLMVAGGVLVAGGLLVDIEKLRGKRE